MAQFFRELLSNNMIETSKYYKRLDTVVKHLCPDPQPTSSLPGLLFSYYLFLNPEKATPS